jgi:hypothetical protein
MNGDSEIKCVGASVKMEYDHPFHAGELNRTFEDTIAILKEYDDNLKIRD